MKKFFKKTEGFTLVELIVVIAILGILAGVGTVGYSGYIKKANQAADEQMISGIMHTLTLAAIGDSSSFSVDGVTTITLTKDNPQAYVVEKRNVTSHDYLPITMAPGGGFAISFEEVK